MLLARDRANGELVGLAGVTIGFEAVDGGGMEEVEAVGNLRAATAILTLDRPRMDDRRPRGVQSRAARSARALPREPGPIPRKSANVTVAWPRFKYLPPPFGVRDSASREQLLVHQVQRRAVRGWTVPRVRMIRETLFSQTSSRGCLVSRVGGPNFWITASLTMWNRSVAKKAEMRNSLPSTNWYSNKIRLHAGDRRRIVLVPDGRRGHG